MITMAMDSLAFAKKARTSLFFDKHACRVSLRAEWVFFAGVEWVFLINAEGAFVVSVVCLVGYKRMVSWNSSTPTGNVQL